MKSFRVHTFGCKVNTYDAGLIQKNLTGGGYASIEAADSPAGENLVHVLNTCAVTAEATKEAVKLIRRIKAKEPNSTVVVTGCAAQVDTGSFENLLGADLVVANSHKGFLPQILDQHFKGTLENRVLKSNIFRKEDLEAGGGLEEHHSRAFLKIQDGCNSFCSYCIIPYARGKSRSIAIRDLVTRSRELHVMGYQEIVLTGVHIGDYQDETRAERNRLEDLVEALLKLTSVPRFRLTSLEPVEISERLLELYQDPRICAHFHMSIQSASTTVLKDMKRNYGEAEVRESLLRIEKRVKNAFVGMDVIAGFPSETEELFEETYRALDETPWTRLHVFPYSERKGTRAAIMEQLNPAVRKARARRLRELSLTRYQQEATKQIGALKEVLLLGRESQKNQERNVRQAVSRDYWTLLVEGASELSHGTSSPEVSVRVTGYEFENSPRMEGVLRGVLERPAFGVPL